ncbi:MAG TPA: SIMPL domain-containing protein, partial [Vicinamibacterales bacterium]
MPALLFVPLLLLTAVPVAAQPRVVPVEPTVAAAGEAIVRRAPDQAFVTIATESRAPRPEAAQQANARAMEKVRRELRDQKIPDAAIRTVSFNLREDFDYTSGGRVSRGFVVTNAIEVRVDDLTRLGRLVDEVIKAGATSISGIRFELKDRDAVEREALRRAVEDARA